MAIRTRTVHCFIFSWWDSWAVWWLSSPLAYGPSSRWRLVSSWSARRTIRRRVSVMPSCMVFQSLWFIWPLVCLSPLCLVLRHSTHWLLMRYSTSSSSCCWWYLRSVSSDGLRFVCRPSGAMPWIQRPVTPVVCSPSSWWLSRWHWWVSLVQVLSSVSCWWKSVHRGAFSVRHSVCLALPWRWLCLSRSLPYSPPGWSRLQNPVPGWIPSRWC